MMNKYFNLVSILVVIMCLATSCIGPYPDSYNKEDLYGYWYNQAVVTDTCRFMRDQVQGESNYCWGKIWDGAQDVCESDLDQDYHGNGWFKWIVETKRLTEIHMMSVSTAAIPEVFTINTLNTTTLVITNQADNKRTIYKRIGE